jgi:hypothetical protein
MHPAFTQSFHASRTTEKIKIDGKLDEAAWGAIEEGEDYYKFAPNPGEINEEKTHTKIIYDDYAVYFGFKLFEKKEDIFSQVNERDNPNRADLVSLIIDTYHNATSAMEFAVTVANTQYDAQWNADFSDSNWDEVWDSATSIVEDGWICEIMIPYAALRFPKEDIQSWNFNVIRIQAKKGQRSSLFNIEPDGATFLAQAKPLLGIEKIKTPVRFSLYPYATVYGIRDKSVDLTSGESTNNYGGAYSVGLDLKYGINDAFTLQSTLVPDFGQVRTDDEVLNISPFEVQFNDNRSFFTEGTEIFSKADLFYSRRIGSTPQKHGSIYNEISVFTEEVVDNPTQNRLLNATKLSGRTKKGTGVGFLNAVEAQTFAKIRNRETNEERSFLTSPISNYNILVIDQNLPHNSSISVINTNVTRFNEDFYNANVLGTEFLLRTKNQKYGIQGSSSYSYIDYKQLADTSKTGLNTDISIGKMTGNWTGGLNVEFVSPNYDKNDLGINFRTNYLSTNAYTSYSFFKQWWKFNRANFWANFTNSVRADSYDYISNHLNIGFWAQSIEQWEFNMWNNYRPAFKDYFEPRVEGRYLNMPGFVNSGYYVQSDSRKKFIVSTFGFVSNAFEEGRIFYEYGLSPTWVINDQLRIASNLSFSASLKEVGSAFVYVPDEIIMGQRNRETVVNSLTVDYNVNANVSLSARGRHYWSNVVYLDYFTLNEDGGLSSYPYDGNSSTNFNFANFDVNLRWRFAPGSDIFVVYKGIISKGQDDDNIIYSDLNYRNGISDLWSSNAENSLSVRLNYFLDYERTRRAFAQRN